MNQMAMMSLGGAYQGAVAAMTLQKIAHAPPQIYQPSALPRYQQGYYSMPKQGVDAPRDVVVDKVALGVDAHKVKAVHRCPYHHQKEHHALYYLQMVLYGAYLLLNGT